MLAEALSELSTYMTFLLGPRVVLDTLAGRLPPEGFWSASWSPSGRTRNDDTVLLPALTTNRHDLLSPSSLRLTGPMLSSTGKPVNAGGLPAGRPLPPVGMSCTCVSWPSAPRLYASTRFGTVFVEVNTAPGVRLVAALALPAAAGGTSSATPSATDSRFHRRRSIRPCMAQPPSLRDLA